MKTKVSACSIFEHKTSGKPDLSCTNCLTNIDIFGNIISFTVCPKNSPPFGKVYIFLASYHKLAS